MNTYYEIDDKSGQNKQIQVEVRCLMLQNIPDANWTQWQSWMATTMSDELIIQLSD